MFPHYATAGIQLLQGGANANSCGSPGCEGGQGILESWESPSLKPEPRMSRAPGVKAFQMGEGT